MAREIVERVMAAGWPGRVLVVLATAVFFAFLYLSAAGIASLLTKRILPALGVGKVVDARPLRPGQRRRELLRSLRSIAIFGLYGLPPIEWIRLFPDAVRWDATLGITLRDMAVLFAWNEIHFYLCHRLLHTRFLYRHVHRIHHESATPTPFSTYSFHWFEAALLGSVMLFPLVVYPFSYLAILSLPVLSLFFNTVGHSNFNIFANVPLLRSAAVEHSEHHRLVSVNFGFYFSWLDRLMKTSLRQRAT